MSHFLEIGYGVDLMQPPIGPDPVELQRCAAMLRRLALDVPKLRQALSLLPQDRPAALGRMFIPAIKAGAWESLERFEFLQWCQHHLAEPVPPASPIGMEVITHLGGSTDYYSFAESILARIAAELTRDAEELERQSTELIAAGGARGEVSSVEPGRWSRIRPGTFFKAYVRGNILDEVSEDDGEPYSLMALDEYHGGDLAGLLYSPQRRWDHGRLTEIEIRVRDAWNLAASEAPDAHDWRLNRIIDLAHVIAQLTLVGQANADHPDCGAISDASVAGPAGAQIVTIGARTWTSRVTCPPHPDGGSSKLTLFGRLSAMQAAFRTRAQRIMPIVPPALHLPDLIRAGSLDSHPLSWSAAELETLSRVPGELVRLGLLLQETGTRDRVTAGGGSDGWLTVSQVHQLTGWGTGVVTRLCNNGELATNGQSGRGRRIDYASVAKLQLRRADAEQLRKLRNAVSGRSNSC